MHAQMTVTPCDDPRGHGHDAFSVESDSGKTYVVRHDGSGDADPEYVSVWSCSCPARVTCAHMRAVLAATVDEYGDMIEIAGPVKVSIERERARASRRT